MKMVCSIDMLDSAIKTKTPRNEPPLDDNFVELSQKDVSNLLATVGCSWLKKQ